MEFNSQVSEPTDIYKTIEHNRNRFEIRTANVYDDLYGIDTSEWIGVKQFVTVERKIYKGANPKPSYEKAFFISSKPLDAKAYNKGIRSHWSIENSLHYIKDVTLLEDASRIRSANAPTNLSIIRNITLNLFRKLDYSSIPQAIRMIGGDIGKLYKLLE